MRNQFLRGLLSVVVGGVLALVLFWVAWTARGRFEARDRIEILWSSRDGDFIVRQWEGGSIRAELTHAGDTTVAEAVRDVTAE